MDTPEDLMYFLNLLDLDEVVVDAPLKYIMGRSNFTNKHLKSAVQLLQYKMMINKQEGTDCENYEEYDFVIKLLKVMNTETIDYVCQIIEIVLSLNSCIIVSSAEHLVQQLLSSIEFQSGIPNDEASPDYDTNVLTLLILKACNSVISAVSKFGDKISLRFLSTPLEKILMSKDEKLKIYFLTNTIPMFVENVVGYKILDVIWSYLQNIDEDGKGDVLKILSCLSDYYLPAQDAKGFTTYTSNIFIQFNFWYLLLFGVTSDDASKRKLAIYLCKRAIDCITNAKQDIHVDALRNTIFDWKKDNSKILKSMWDNYFILVDSLEEKQANIVLPSLKLFESIKIEDCWVNAAFTIGLKHDNPQVRVKSIEYKLKTVIKHQTVAYIFLEALNDLQIYDQYLNLETQISEFLKNKQTIIEILKAIPLINWSPVPLYFLTKILAGLILSEIEICADDDIYKIIIDVLKVPCNNVILRKAIHVNLVYFLKNNCVYEDWKYIASVYSTIPMDTFLLEDDEENPFTSIVKVISMQQEEKPDNITDMMKDANNIDLILLYLNNNEEDMTFFIDVINEKIKQLQDGINRQYADKKKIYLNDVIFLINYLNKAKENAIFRDINEVIARQSKTILLHILSLFSSEGVLDISNAVDLFEKYEFVKENIGEILLELYKTSVLFLKNRPASDKAVFSIFAIKMLLKNPVMTNNYGHQMIGIESFVDIITNFKFDPYDECGKSRNLFYEKSCEIIYIFINKEKDVNSVLNQLISFIEIVLECGGYGCLIWILKIVNKVVQPLVKTDFNMIPFINQVWTEIEELKSNNQYSPCIEQFVKLIMQDALLGEIMYKNIIISYCNKIIEYGPVKTNPLYYLINELKTKDFKVHGYLIYVLCEILHYCPVPRKDQRIADNVTLEVLRNPKYKINKECIDTHFNFEIQYLSLATLCNIDDAETLRMITNFITIRIDNTFKNKQRYHGNSQLHRVLQTTLQHILIRMLKGGDLEKIFDWCLDLLVKLPHQPSVRISFEWFISLYFYIQNININEEMVQILKSKNVPVISQFFILYWLIKHKITNKTYSEYEYNFVMDFLLSYTMGQLFNVRLNAQYLATTLYKAANKKTKYQYTIDIIEKTFTECNSDKSFSKLRSDYFTNDFDIVANLTPCFVYYLLPKYCGLDNENVDADFIKNILKDVDESLSKSDGDNNFLNEWKLSKRSNEEFIEFEKSKDIDKNILEEAGTMGPIQKKYIPWRNMSNINVYDVSKKRKCSSQLIVVASLVDKLPNLGGLARTSEVFGVKTYVIDSLRHLQDKQFQGLSVSAEKWINIEQVRPGRTLKEYLIKKKEEGYSVVAAEQTSTSMKLQKFKFPMKTLLLLGHEKEGIPCDLLTLMDYCVEIPQQGYVRSLNVHVTAAIFVWEYGRQNVLT